MTGSEEWAEYIERKWLDGEPSGQPVGFIISRTRSTDMIFETLYESAKRGELLIINGGLCHWHLRRDKQLTIREIIATRLGAGSEMLEYLKSVEGATSLFAKCPAELDANEWYARKGFECEGEEITRTGRRLKLWRLYL